MKHEIGKIIRKYREKCRLSQRDLAEMLKVSNSCVSNWEQGINRPDADTLGKLCWALNVSPSVLLGVRVSDRDLSDREYDVVKAYREKPEMQHAVNVLLGLEEDGKA